MHVCVEVGVTIARLKYNKKISEFYIYTIKNIFNIPEKSVVFYFSLL